MLEVFVLWLHHDNGHFLDSYGPTSPINIPGLRVIAGLIM